MKTLSDQINDGTACDTGSDMIYLRDVKQFIKDLKEEIGSIPVTIDGTYFESICETIDKLVGDKLI